MIDFAKGITTVFVDLDDTIWDFSANSLLALRNVAARHSLYSTDDEYRHFIDVYHDINSRLWEMYHYGKIEKDYLVNERFRFTLQAIGFSHENLHSKAAELNEDYLTTLSKLPTIVDGADRMLEYLKGKYRVAVLSNGFKGIQARKLRSAGLDKYIDAIVLSDDCGITKPLPGIFEYALQRMDCTANQAVMIGDNLDADISGALNAGWRAIFFNRKRVEYTSSDRVVEVKTLYDVADVL